MRKQRWTIPDSYSLSSEKHSCCYLIASVLHLIVSKHKRSLCLGGPRMFPIVQLPKLSSGWHDIFQDSEWMDGEKNWTLITKSFQRFGLKSLLRLDSNVPFFYGQQRTISTQSPPQSFTFSFTFTNFVRTNSSDSEPQPDRHILYQEETSACSSTHI